MLWDWPFGDDGMACCSIVDNQFNVRLKFAYLKTAKYVDVKKFEDLKTSHYSFQIGLCRPDKRQSGEATFWRLEMQVLRAMNMIVIDAERDISSADNDGAHDNGANNLQRRMKRIRRMYRLPTNFDINTLQTSITADGCFQLTAEPLTEPQRPQRNAASTAQLRRCSTLASELTE